MKIGSVLLVVWLIIGAIAGAQRHNPKISCTAPKPSQ